MSSLRLKNVSVTYHQRRRTVHAVQGIDLSIDKGQTVALVGESGSGKSSTARLVAGLQKPTTGTIEWHDVSTSKTLASTPHVQMVFQHPDQSLDPTWTVARSIAEPLVRAGGIDRREIARRCAEFVERVGLSQEHLRRHPRDLSGGQAQRVAIARALIPTPEIVVLDEPTASLDQTVRARLLSTLAELQHETGVGYLMVTHDMSSVRRLAEQVYVMYLGRIVESGTVDQIMDAPAHPYTRALIEAVPPADPRAHWNPRPFAGPSAATPQIECPVGPSCEQHTAGLHEIGPGHLVACCRSGDALSATLGTVS